MRNDEYDKRKRNERLIRVAVLLVVAPTAIAFIGLVVWLAFFPPFSGT